MKKNIFVLIIISVLTFMVCGCGQKETVGGEIMKTAVNGVLSGQENLFTKYKTAIIKTN